MREVEVLVRLVSPREEAVAAVERVATHVRTAVTEDRYFLDPLRGDLKPDAECRLRACMRVRRKEPGRSTVAYKHDNFDADGRWVYSDEFESPVDDAGTAEEILTRLGLQPLVTVRTTKHVYKNDWCEVVLEEVTDLGNFLEVEAHSVSESDSPEAVKARIEAFIASLGLATTRNYDGGKPELLLRRSAGLPID